MVLVTRFFLLTPHRCMSLFPWCALDTLIFPVWLERSAQVSSSYPVTGRPLHLTVTPEGLERLATPSGVISLLLQEGVANCCVMALTPRCTLVAELAFHEPRDDNQRLAQMPIISSQLTPFSERKKRSISDLSP
jgi:hypothetical protein